MDRVEASAATRDRLTVAASRGAGSGDNLPTGGWFAERTWGERNFGFHSTAGITFWIRLFLFVVLFGLRLHGPPRVHPRPRPRGRRQGHDHRERVAHAIRTTAGVVTSAAIVMVAVFSIFGSLSTVTMKELSVGLDLGLVVAVLLDATIVRTVLLPDTVKLVGEWNCGSRIRCSGSRVSFEERTSVPTPAAEPAAASSLKPAVEVAS